MTPKSTYRYLTTTPEAIAWGVTVSGAGRHLIHAGGEYPPKGHPKDHQFSWDRGRVLPGLQFLYLVKGQGEFEATGISRRRIEAGELVILRPGVWHRYRPAPETGWEEMWVEFAGPVIERQLALEGFLARTTVVALSERIGYEAMMTALIRELGTEDYLGPAALAARALALLERVERVCVEKAAEGGTLAAIARARRLLEEGDTASLSLPRLARGFGMPYSTFRREFKRHLGVSPGKYLMSCRMARAQRLLGMTDRTLNEIAEVLGFSSAFHLSSAFKKHFGKSPRAWRRG